MPYRSIIAHANSLRRPPRGGDTEAWGVAVVKYCLLWSRATRRRRRGRRRAKMASNPVVKISVGRRRTVRRIITNDYRSSVASIRRSSTPRRPLSQVDSERCITIELWSFDRGLNAVRLFVLYPDVSAVCMLLPYLILRSVPPEDAPGSANAIRRRMQRHLASRASSQMQIITEWIISEREVYVLVQLVVESNTRLQIKIRKRSNGSILRSNTAWPCSSASMFRLHNFKKNIC